MKHICRNWRSGEVGVTERAGRGEDRSRARVECAQGQEFVYTYKAHTMCGTHEGVMEQQH